MRRMSDAPETPAPSAPEPVSESSSAVSPRWRHPLVLSIAGLAVGAAAVGLVWGLSSSNAGSAGASKPVKTFTMKGDVKLVLSLHEALQQLSQGGQCMPHHSGPYADVQEGATVTVYSAGGKVVATGQLQAGVPSARDCTFPFTASGVPEGEKFYQVEVDHSGRMTVSAEKALKGDAVIELQLS